VGCGVGHNVHTANNVICIGANVLGIGVSNTCFIGNIRDIATQNADATPVVIDSAGQLGTLSSSARFKKDIKPMDKASEAILALKPVTFQYKTDKTSTAQFGLIAEEVAKVNPNLVVRDRNGEIYSVRYDAVNAMLLNEFLKEHRKVEELKSAMALQQKDFEMAMAQQRKATEAGVARLNQQETRIQSVNAKVEAHKPAPQMLVENQ
jgi:Chaperone of endosialidase